MFGDTQTVVNGTIALRGIQASGAAQVGSGYTGDRFHCLG